MSEQMLIRINPELKEKLSLLARYQGKSASKMVREIIEDYVKERDIGAYIDGLWERIGKKIKAKGVEKSDIAKKIKEVRQKKK